MQIEVILNELHQLLDVNVVNKALIDLLIIDVISNSSSLLGPPVLIGPFKPLYTVKEGQNVKLRCKFSGTDDSADNRTLTAWQKLPEGHYITDKYERFKMRNGRYLRIKKVKLEDRGTYACIAYNPFGKIKKEIQLVVQGKRSRSKLLFVALYSFILLAEVEPPPGGGTRYIFEWGGAARPLRPWPYLRQKPSDFLYPV